MLLQAHPKHTCACNRCVIRLCLRACHSPCEHHHKVHDIPSIPQVRVLVEGETECQDLYSRLKTEDPDEVWLCIILEGGAKEVKGGYKRKSNELKNPYKYVSTCCQPSFLNGYMQMGENVSAPVCE